MAVQISVPGFHPGPRLAVPLHPFFPPPNVLPPPDSGLTQQSIASAVMAPKPDITPMAPSSNSTSSGPNGAASSGSGQTGGTSFDGRRMRSKTAIRRTVDYNASVANWIQNRIWQRDHRDMRATQPEAIYNPMLVPPAMLLSNPVSSLATRSVRVAMNKVKCPIFCTCWTPEGRRLVTGASSGEFTLWNGLTFSFETILQAHDTSVRAMIWSHNDTWMLTADHGGYVKYWQSNMNNVKMYQAHKDPVRGLSFCPLDQKFASCSDDGTVRIWDFLRCQEERCLRGHGADVKCVDWHPLKGLVASGSKDTQQPVKLWDPRTGASLATIHAHKHTVMDLKWNRNGNWLLTASRDHLLKIFDIRNLKEEMQSFRGHKKEATTLAWHPVHECLFASGGSDGAIMFWLVGNEKELGSIDEAHETMVWSMSWHPLGHILVSGSNDHTTKFWTRNRPGDSMKDRYNLNTLPAGMSDELDYDYDHMNQPTVPGLGHEFIPDVSSRSNQDGNDMVSVPSIPGLDLSPEKPIMSDAASGGLLAGDSRYSRKKAIYTKPVPKDFERAWTEGRQPSAIVSARDHIPDERQINDPSGGRPNFDNRGPQYEPPRNPYKWHGPVRHPGPDGPHNHDQPNPVMHGPEQMPPPGQGFPMGPQQGGPPGGPRGPMPAGAPRGPMPPGPQNPMVPRMPNPMQQQQQGMMPPPSSGPPRPQQMNQPIRGPMGMQGPPGPQGPPGTQGPPGPPGPPRPLLSLSFQEREMHQGGGPIGHPGPGGPPGMGRGMPPRMMPPGPEDDNLHPPPGPAPYVHFGDQPVDNVDTYREGPNRSSAEFHGGFNEIPDNGDHFEGRLGDVDYRSNSFSSGEGAASHPDQYPMMGPDANGRGGWRRPRGGPPNQGPDNRNQGPPGGEPFPGRNRPPSLLDMKLGPAHPPSMGLKRKWEGPPTDEEPEFQMPPMDNHPPGPFGMNPDISHEDPDNWPPDAPRPFNPGRGRGNFFRGGPPGRGAPRGRVMRGGGGRGR